MTFLPYFAWTPSMPDGILGSESNDDLFESDEKQLTISAMQVSELVSEINERDSRLDWNSNVELDLGASKWRPPAVSGDSTRVLYFCASNEIPKYVRKRLTAATEKGIRPVIALHVPTLYVPDVLSTLAEIDADVYVLDDIKEDRRFRSRHVLAAMADIEVPASPDLRREIGSQVLARLGQGSNNRKGERLEALLAFLFAQVSDLRVVARNYRNETEEIDLVLQIDNFSQRVWQRPGMPFILVESKNTAEKASQPMMSTLITKIQTKRGSVRLGILVSPAGFTEDARAQEMRFSSQDICVPMIDQDGLDRLIRAVDLDAELEDIIRSALLR